jgi:Mono-functional DNA-alkylating methyl methanesulfonate N-term
MKPHLLQIFPNWSPILDLAIVRPQKFSQPSRIQPSIFVTSGRQPHGFVTELRLGHEASVKLECRVDEIVNAATGLWAVSDASLEGRIFFISFPGHTTVIRMMNDYEVILEPEESGADQTEQTMVVMQTDEVIIQVTKQNIHLLEFDEANGTLHRSATLDLTTLQVLAAAVEPKAPFVILACQTESGPVLQTYLAQRVNGNMALRVIGDSFPIEDLPTSVVIFEHDQNFYAVVGGQTVTFFSFSPKFGLLKRATLNPNEEMSSSQSVVIEDIIVLSDPDSYTMELLIICGLRGGNIYTLNLDIERLKIKRLAGKQKVYSTNRRMY